MLYFNNALYVMMKTGKYILNNNLNRWRFKFYFSLSFQNLSWIT